MNNKNLKIILIAFVIIIVLIIGLLLFLKKDNNEKLDNNNSNVEDQVNDKKYIYTKDLSNDDKKNIIEKNDGSCKLIETVDFNKEIENYFTFDAIGIAYGYNKHLLINKIMKFDCADGKDKIVVDYSQYGIDPVRSYYSVRVNLVDGDGNAIDKTSIYTQVGYDNVGDNTNLEYQYQTFPYRLEFGDKVKVNFLIENRSTKLSGYWYYDVEDQSKIDLDNLYVYYESDNKKENLYKIKNSDYDFSYKKVKLQKGTDVIPSNVYYFFTNSKNNVEDNSIKKYMMHELLYNTDGKSLGSETFDAIATFSSYHIEKWNGKNVLIVPYVLKNDTSVDEYAKYQNMSKKYVYLSDSEGRFYSPVNINTHLNDELYLINKEQNLEAIYILPDNYDLNSMFLVFEDDNYTFNSNGAIRLDKLTKE